jgi:hypothetical protein
MFNTKVCYAHMRDLHIIGKNGKAIPVTGREGLNCCETSRLPYFLDIRLTDGGEVISHLDRAKYDTSLELNACFKILKSYKF